MRASFTTTVAASLAALTLVASVAAANADPWRHHNWGHGYGHGYGYGHSYGWGPGIAFGFLGAGLLANSCLRSSPIYDRWGNYVGTRTINVCY